MKCVNKKGWLRRAYLPRTTPTMNPTADCSAKSPKVDLWELLKQELLQAGCMHIWSNIVSVRK